MTGFNAPNHTQTPNELFDLHMADMGECELKVTLAVIRQTLGYHKEKDPISLSQLQKITGLSRPGVIEGSDKAIERGLIEIVGTGSRGVNIYGLVINFNQSDEPDQLEILTRTGKKSLHTKETTQKKLKTLAPNGAQDDPAPKKQREPNPIFDAVAQYVFEIASSEVNGEGGRIGILASWLSGKSDGVQHGKTRVTVGFISAPAKPEHVIAFAGYWKSTSKANMPYDLQKFVDAWRKWVSGLKQNSVRREHQNGAAVSEVSLSDSEVEARKQQLSNARKGNQS